MYMTCECLKRDPQETQRKGRRSGLYVACDLRHNIVNFPFGKALFADHPKPYLHLNIFQ